MRLSVLGSTGSIGRQTLELARCFDDMSIGALAAFGNIDLIEEQIHEFDPEICCIYNEEKAKNTTNISASFSAKGTVTIKVYVDDIIKGTKEINMNSTTSCIFE